MKTKDIEKLAYFYLSCPKDRKILSGKLPMKYYDFRRLTYLIGCIGFNEYASHVWRKHVDEFKENMDAYEKIQEEKRFFRDFYEDLEYETNEEKGWVRDFIKNAPFEVRKWLRECLQDYDMD